MRVLGVGEVDLPVVMDQVTDLVAGAPWVGSERIVPGGSKEYLAAKVAAADAYLHEGLTAILDVPVVSVEDPRPSLKGTRLVWAVNPLDAKLNVYPGGRQNNFAMTVGLVAARGAQVHVAVTRQSRGDAYSAAKGHGAYQNKAPLPVRVPDSDVARRGIIAFNRRIDDNVTDPELRVTDALQQIMRAGHVTRQSGSVAVDVCNLAEGKWQAFFMYGLDFCDLPALAIAKEAGCRVRVVSAGQTNPTGLPTFDVIAARDLTLLRQVMRYTGL